MRTKNPSSPTSASERTDERINNGIILIYCSVSDRPPTPAYLSAVKTSLLLSMLLLNPDTHPLNTFSEFYESEFVAVYL